MKTVRHESVELPPQVLIVLLGALSMCDGFTPLGMLSEWSSRAVDHDGFMYFCSKREMEVDGAVQVVIELTKDRAMYLPNGGFEPEIYHFAPQEMLGAIEALLPLVVDASSVVKEPEPEEPAAQTVVLELASVTVGDGVEAYIALTGDAVRSVVVPRETPNRHLVLSAVIEGIQKESGQAYTSLGEWAVMVGRPVDGQDGHWEFWAGDPAEGESDVLAFAVVDVRPVA